MFKKGDKVVVKRGSPYDITGGGSEGTIISTYEGHFAKVRFHKVTGDRSYFGKKNNTFSIDINHLKLLQGDWDM